MKMSEKEFDDLMAKRKGWSKKIDPKPKPKPMSRPTGKPEVQLGLDMDAPDFGLESDLLSLEFSESRVEKFFVQYMAPSLNAIYAGIHWTKRKKHADEGHRACQPLEIAPFTKPVRLTFRPVVGKKARARDCSNYAYAAKVVEDGLVKAGIIKDDTNQYVKSFTIEEPVTDRSIESGMWVYIEEAA